MKQFSTLFLLALFTFLCPCVRAQINLIDFEDQNVPLDSFINDAGDGSFDLGALELPNSFTQTPTFSFWSGWSISSVIDTLDPAFTNQYASLTGGGADSSDTYGIAFSSTNMVNRTADGEFVSMEVTNTTYAALTIRDGNQFSSAFGGESGNDPDFLLLTLRGKIGDSLLTDSIDFFLADYRFDDNSQDYIVNEWTPIDLTPLATADTILFRFSGSDTGEFGLNTPAYVAVDNIGIIGNPVSVTNVPAAEFTVFPNPVREQIFVRSELPWNEFRIFSMEGKLLGRGRRGNEIGTAGLVRGSYLLQLQMDDGRVANRIFSKL